MSQMDSPSKAKGTQHTQIAQTVFQRKPRDKGEYNGGIGTKGLLPAESPKMQ